MALQKSAHDFQGCDENGDLLNDFDGFLQHFYRRLEYLHIFKSVCISYFSGGYVA
jgi:hypothetical protein